MTNQALLLSRTDAAKLLGVSPSTFSAWVSAGILPGPLPGTQRWSRIQIERAAAGQVWVPPEVAVDAEPEVDPWAEYDRRKEKERSHNGSLASRSINSKEHVAQLLQPKAKKR